MTPPKLRLILFSGLPATGKSTLSQRLAREFSIPVFSKDQFDSILHAVHLDKTVHTYRLLLGLADQQLGLGISVILDAEFSQQEFRNKARAIAEKHNARFYAIHTLCTNEQTHLLRLVGHDRSVPFTPVTWEQVVRARATFEPWEPLEALFVDTVDPLERNYAKVLAYLKT
jgi:hypothetical protein